MMATYYNNVESAKCLLELGANPNLYNDTTKLWGENSVLIASRRMTLLQKCYTCYYIMVEILILRLKA